MSKHKNLKRNLLICLLAGSAVMYTLPLHAATSVVANNALPTLPMVNGQIKDGYGFVTGGSNTNIVTDGLQMNITQNKLNAVIKWGSFDVGGSATVNFKGPESGYNTLNYVNAGGSMSQIYGTINANNNGNIFIVNPAGVQIGNSAQINVGSLYVSNKYLNEDKLGAFAGKITPEMINATKTADAALMSLGNINITNVKNGNVTFEGNGRIVIDTERIKKNDVVTDNFIVKTDDVNDVLLGYDAYNTGAKKDTYAGKDKTFNDNVLVNGQKPTEDVKGYMWVEDVEQLQAIDTNLSGNYALRNSIDATATENWNNNKGFSSIGVDENGKTKGVGFTGNFDGIDYNIFGLTINRSDETNVGLFGAATNANINNVTLVGGKIIGGTDVGAIVGAAEMTNISNVTNSAKVEGNNSVGGIVGVADATTVENAINTGAVEAKGNDIGGLIGSMTDTNITDNKKSELIGNSYNLGDVSSEGHNVGGLVGHAVNSTIGDGTNLVYNRMDVTGAYNVGGIVGNMKGSTVKYAENSGTVMASGSVTDKYNYHTDIANKDNLPAGSSLNDGIVSIDVNVANVGGIAGSSSDSSTIKDVTNTGDVSSGKGNDTENVNKQEYDYEYYTAGNVGGIVGSAVDTNITNATNRENEIRGAHNVGGVVGYFSGTGTIDKGINDGGDIMATGARNGDGFVMESVRQSGDEDFIIGNIGGIVGYMDGKGVKVTGSANRGTVHTENIEDADNVLTISKAANVGGIVGKIDANTNETGLLSDFRNGNYKNASVSNSYNTGNVTGYTGVGGVIGMMYNGSVAGSYNQGAINTTRQVYRGGGSNIDPLNMGGIVGDTTEQTSASAVIYDVYNEGQIGDENFEFYARHVGGIVGRLSGTVEKAYNTGDIYNNDTAVGGIVGWWYNGNIKNVFNTGNITVRSATELQVGGIAGAAAGGVETLENAYNLGTIRGYKEGVDASNNPINGTDDYIYVGGIIGRARGGNALTIRNVYTMGNLYAGVGTYNNATGTYSYELTKTNGLGAIYGGNEEPTLQGANYIIPDSKDFKDLSGQSGVNDIIYSDRYKKDKYEFVNVGTTGNIFSVQEEESGTVEGATDDNWRIYEDNTTPILNAFLPNVEDYFNDDNNMTNINTIQYGTAYNPLLTIIKANGDLSYDWNKLGISGAASLAVYGGGLTLDNVDTSGGTGYYSGLLYTDKDLTLIATNKNNEPDATKVSGDIGLGSGAELYGSSVKIEADGTVTVYGSVTATGETAGSTGDINITAGDVDVYGTLTTGKPVSIAGIEGSAQKVDTNFENVNNPNEAMIHISERFAHEIDSANGATNNITINAGTKLVVGDDGNPILDKDGNEQYVNIGNGNVNLYFGNKEQGLITTSGNLTVTGTGDVYVDSDLDIGGNLTLTGNGENSEVVLDLTNIGQVQAKNELAENPNSNVTALDKFHDFMHHFGSQIDDDNQQIMLNAKISGDAKLTIDMWDKTQNNGQGGYNLNKYDQNTGHDLVTELNNLNINADIKTNNGTIGNVTSAKPITYIWVSDGDQLQAINNNGVNGLSYNYALKNDINASDVTGYEAIGTNSANGFIGTFDGRGNRIIGLDTTKDANVGNTNAMVNAGIFSTIGEGGTVKNVNIYSGNFEGTNTAGAVAGVNNGRIENVTGFGNTVQVNGAGIAGGIVGKNEGKGNFVTADGASTLTGNGIYDVQSIGSVITASGVAGGLVGTNDGTLGNSYSDSAVTSAGTSAGLGGVVGVNTEKGDVQFVDSLGVTNGGTNSDKVGGIIGVNNGNMYSGYNESIVSGKDNVGGIIGVNTNTVSNIVNATGVVGTNNIGGLVGDNSNSVTNGRNNGTITGVENVGGLVGYNGKDAVLTDLVNAEAADITGVTNVGGIAGSNAGTITTGKADDESEKANLINRGSITGHTYVGGVAGTNSGTITNANNNVELNADTTGAQYFGGIAGENTGTIENATNTANVNAAGAEYVGGIVGLNNSTLNGSSNEGSVTGLNFVGGVAGKNAAEIKGTLTNGELTTIKNSGTVTAGKGGAGGIFGVNEGVIDSIHLVSEGIVKGTNPKTGESGTGGIFGINKGKITNSVLENTKGTVSGVSNTGGLIGINSGDISQTSLKNVADINIDNEDKVLNIGGLIGKNTGKIEGGRDAADSYYKYQIYNNGTITVTGEGENIGGLIGYNTIASVTPGSLTAGYNTGAINAENSSNVGGIVGKNEGIVDQVFNTVMTGVDDKGNTVYGTITGKDNVGGLVGTNSGTLSNAYNTTAVNGAEGSTGNAVGVNDGNGIIENIYASNTSGNLIGAGYDNVTNAYSFSDDDNCIDDNITVIAEDDRQNSDSYSGFDFDGTNTKSPVWKNYDGSGNPLLKVFLTKASYSGNSEFTYNGQNQGVDIEKITAFDQLNAYKNANDLLQNLTNKDSGNYTIYSQQIAASGKGEDFNPNNLGYDIDTTYTIKKVNLKVYLDEISRKYGNAAITNITNGSDDYGFNFGNIVLTQEMLAELTSDNLGFNIVEDGAVKDITGDRKTNNAGEYNWRATFSLSDELAKNYQFDNNGSTNFEITNGKSIVTAVDLTIDLNDISRVYGNLDKGNYQFNATGLVNGDEIADLILKVTNDGAIAAGTIDNPQKTASVGTYEWSGTVSNADNTLSTNYNIKYVDDGKAVSEVTSAKLNIKVDNANTTVGKMPGELTGTVEGLTNGDTLPTHDFALKDDSLISVSGNHEDVIGIVIGGKFYELGDADWSNGLFANYDVNYEMGDLAVSVVEIPDNWPNNRWDYLFGDNPFDRNENFRERKAEVNFVDGAMEI